MFLGSKVRLVRGAGKLTAIHIVYCLDNVGSLSSHNPIGLHRLLLFYFYIQLRGIWN
jgi:hypothetical protein